MKLLSDLAQSIIEYKTLIDSDEKIVASSLLTLLTKINLSIISISVDGVCLTGDTDGIDAVPIFKKLNDRVPFNSYQVVFDPHRMPPDDDEPVMGLLADDLADIYKDVVPALTLYKRGDIEDAQNHWTFTYYSHWGQHIASAMRALNCWIVDDLMSVRTRA